MSAKFIAVVGALLISVIATMAKGEPLAPAPKCQEGGIVRAIDQSYQDFSTFLSKVSAQPESKPMREFLRKIESYQVIAVLERDNYTVKFLPYNYPGGTIKGAGAKYSVNKCTFRIEDIQGRAPLE
ncbi:hypothetical protein [Xanthomonas medicagonis]|uniref:hypothetical protein n=1 Tax=Xanthomonas medicagonis TaxID=3160841 RepID=UPI003518A4B7